MICILQIMNEELQGVIYFLKMDKQFAFQQSKSRFFNCTVIKMGHVFWVCLNWN